MWWPEDVSRSVAEGAAPPEQPFELRVEVATRLQFDSESSTHSTLLQVISQDVPGLLRQIALSLAAHQCDIKVRSSIRRRNRNDVFYLTRREKKLSEQVQSTLAADLTSGLNAMRTRRLSRKPSQTINSLANPDRILRH